MAICTVKVTRTKVETAIVDVDLDGTDNDSVDQSLEDLVSNEGDKRDLLAKIKEGEWELDDENHEFEVDQYVFEEEEEDE